LDNEKGKNMNYQKNADEIEFKKYYELPIASGKVQNLPT